MAKYKTFQQKGKKCHQGTLYGDMVRMAGVERMEGVTCWEGVGRCTN